MRTDILRRLFGAQHTPTIRTALQSGARVHAVLLEAAPQPRRPGQATLRGQVQAAPDPDDEQQSPNSGVQQLNTRACVSVIPFL